MSPQRAEEEVAPIGADLEGLDALETPAEKRTSPARRIWALAWPKLAAAFIALVVWQALVWSGWRPSYVLPGPGPVFRRLFADLSNGVLPRAVATTMRRAVAGYGIAVLIGTVLGVSISGVPVLRRALGSLLASLQTMPSIAWFPLAILLFKLSESAILFVVVLGAAPAIAGGIVYGIDHIPPVLLRAGRVLGARGLGAYRHVVFPAALPAFVAGLKQGWAFAWRSLMAGELLVIIANRPSLGVRLQFARELSDSEGMLAAMIVILAIGVLVDSLIFGSAAAFLRRRRGLVDAATRP
jgi:NitT/TauT family transport system permease protein